MFQFLIGRINTRVATFFDNRIRMFQFLIGRINTRNKALFTRGVYTVSIPYR